MKVKDLMNAVPLNYITPETKLVNATKIMKETNVGALPIVDENSKVIGIVTDRDICLALAEKANKNAGELNIKEILPQAKIHTVKADDNITDALHDMRKYKVGRLPVTDKSGKLKGMISVNNLLSHAIKTKENIGDVSSKDETLAKTIKALFERNSTSKVKLAEKKPKIQLSDEYI